MSNKPSDKQLLATAKAQFAAPPRSTDHPIAGLSVPKLISFRKGETINPYRAEPQPAINTTNSSLQPSNTTPGTDYQQIQQRQQLQAQQLQQQQQLNPDSRFELDPMSPPIVRLTQQSTEGDGRFLKARLRDPNIMRIVRLFLAYMKDQPANVCIDGMTPTSIRMLLASEGLPTSPDHLHRIFTEVHQEYGESPADAAEDLETYRHYLSSERTRRLQQIRESTNKFYSPSPGPSNFRK